jgi:hypothetical protein
MIISFSKTYRSSWKNKTPPRMEFIALPNTLLGLSFKKSVEVNPVKPGQPS